MRGSPNNHAYGRMATQSDQPQLLDRDETLMTAEEVARLLNVPRSSVYEYARRQTNPLPSIAIGRHIRFIHTDIETWLTELRRGRWAGPIP